MKSRDVPELTRVSSKGQVVIPARVRNRLGIRAGGVFAVLSQPKAGVVVLKKVDDRSLQIDLELFREIERAWKEIETGKARKASKSQFLDELRTW